MENKPSPTVIVNGLDSDGISLISPEDPNFESAVTRLLAKRTATVALGLKPCLVIVSNNSTRAIVAYRLVWKITDQSDGTNTTAVQSKYPDAITSLPESSLAGRTSREGLSILSGESRVVSTEFELGASWDDEFYLNQLRGQVAQMKQGLSTARQIEIDLEAAIFSDGLLVGPNQRNLDKAFMDYFESKQKLFRQIVGDFESGRTLDQAFAPIESLAATRVDPRKDQQGFYEIIAAQDINALRKRVGDSVVTEKVRRSIRTEPFTIHRGQPE